jgi:hypothetical protein
LQKWGQACRTTWRFSERLCQCLTQAVQPILQEGDYESAIAVLTPAFQQNGDVPSFVELGGMSVAGW